MTKRRTLLILILLILVALLSAVAGTLAGLIKLPELISAQPLVALLLVGVALGGLGLWVWRLQSPPDAHQVPASLALRNRQQMLAKVRAFWIGDVLEHSLHGAALLALGLKEQPDAVANPWELILQQPDRAPHPLPPGTRISQVYDTASGELLILGEPGSGKTTLLLELARDLLTRAEQDETHPIPVVLNLSSWAEQQQPLARWLVEEMNLKYQVPRKVGQAWVENNDLLLLLDGLDEVKAEARVACVESINGYRLEHGLSPLVVCCRTTEYLAQQTRVQLRSAVAVQPLTSEQVSAYLARAGEHLDGLRQAVQADPDLQELATTPLMVSVMTLAYEGALVEELLVAHAAPERRRQIFATYVQRMLHRRGAQTRYSDEQTSAWLAWLARQMKIHSQTEFYLERLQPDWLPPGWRRCIYSIVGAKLFTGLATGLRIGLLIGFFLGCFVALVTTPAIFDLFSYESHRASLDFQELVLELLARSGTILVAGFEGGVFGGLLVAPVSGLLNIVGGALFRRSKGSEIRPAEVVFFSWKKMLGTTLKVLGSMLLSGIGLGLFAVSTSGDTQELIGHYGDILGRLLVEGAILGAFGGLLVGLLIGVLFGVGYGWTSERLEKHHLVKPNEGIRRSARNGLRTGLISLLVSGPVYLAAVGTYLPSAYSSDPHFFVDWLIVLLVSLLLGIFVVVVFGLSNGGLAVFQHFFLRFLLRRSRVLPKHYDRFLDKAAELILLRKVGGGYIFIHRLLLDYFASLAAPANAFTPLVTQSSSAGTPEQPCPHCGAFLPISARFCGRCGQAFTIPTRDGATGAPGK